MFGTVLTACTVDAPQTQPAARVARSTPSQAEPAAAEETAAPPSERAVPTSALPASTTQAPAQRASGDLFAVDVVHTLHLRYAAAAWQAQQNDIELKLGGALPGPQGDYQHADPAYVEVEATLAGQTLDHVGVRYKGAASLVDAWQQGIAKLPFRLDFDRFANQYPATKDRAVLGHRKLTFANHYAERTYLREVLASEILRNRGVPAPRAAFYRVTADRGDGVPLYLGLYTCVEDPSDALPGRDLGAADGNVYKPEGPGAEWMAFQESGFAKKTNKVKADWTDVQAAMVALHAPANDPASWRAVLAERFDVTGFLRWLAVNTAMWNVDAYGMRAANYYLVGVPAQAGRLHWVPWDHSEAFSVMRDWKTQDGPPHYDPAYVRHDQIGANWPLVRKLLDDPTLRAVYDKELKSALGGAYAIAAFAKRASDLHMLIAPHVDGPKGEVAPYSALLWEGKRSPLQGPAELAAHVAAMHALIQGAVD